MSDESVKGLARLAASGTPVPRVRLLIGGWFVSGQPVSGDQYLRHQAGKKTAAVASEGLARAFGGGTALASSHDASGLNLVDVVVTGSGETISLAGLRVANTEILGWTVSEAVSLTKKGGGGAFAYSE